MTTDVQARRPEMLRRIEQLGPQLSRLSVDVDRFRRVIRTEVQNNPELLECEPTSLLGAVMLSAQLDLEPGRDLGGQCWLIPRYDKHIKAKRCHFMLGYRGMVELGERAGWRISAAVIREDDEFSYRLQPDADINHDQAFPHDSPIVGAYAKAVPLDGVGPNQVVVLDREEIEQRRHAGGSGESFAWKDWYPAMARKTAIRALWKQLPSRSRHMEMADRADGTTIDLRDLDSPDDPELEGDGAVEVIDQRPDREEDGEPEASDGEPEASDGGGDVSAGQQGSERAEPAEDAAGADGDPCPHDGPLDNADTAGAKRCRRCGDVLDRRPVAARARDLEVFPADLCQEATGIARDDLGLDDVYMAAGDLDDAPDGVTDRLHLWLDRIADDAEADGT